ncbi:DHHA1 domain-containing protein [Ureaplasma miroungigenitalium]|uniref:DHH family phosphoesterase n=1 Tax=Ureaplasma miroungigenitalium TaxID=1042321 RepID=UPI0021E7B47A|nr:DHH family phosphoesterase [Ureaplasma miroungigenitalium]MCV3734120.1 DHHA1 domain-containing protein [Ureaplasma miroungigenitalium]
MFLKNNENLIHDLKTFWNYVTKAKKVVLCTHVEPDGDTLGSAIALQELIRLNLPDKPVQISGYDYPRNLHFLIDEPINLVSDDFFDDALKIVVDTSTQRRIQDSRVQTQHALKFDHHQEEGEWLFAIGGDHWPATGEPLSILAATLDLKVNEKCLEALGTAILTDTEFMRERNISDQTFAVMAWLIQKGLDYLGLLKKLQLTTSEKNLIFNYLNQKQIQDDIDFLIVNEVVPNDIVRPLTAQFAQLAGSEVCFMLLKKPDGNYRGEIRSKTTFDVSRVAKIFGGGGHFNSAGFIVASPEYAKQIIKEIKLLA